MSFKAATATANNLFITLNAMAKCKSKDPFKVYQHYFRFIDLVDLTGLEFVYTAVQKRKELVTHKVVKLHILWI